VQDIVKAHFDKYFEARQRDRLTRDPAPSGRPWVGCVFFVNDLLPEDWSAHV
jgi:hypothetical protein